MKSKKFRKNNHKAKKTQNFFIANQNSKSGSEDQSGQALGKLKKNSYLCYKCWGQIFNTLAIKINATTIKKPKN